MLKKHSQLFVTLRFFADIVVVALSWILSYYIRFHIEPVPITKGIPPLHTYLEFLVFIILIWGFSLKVSGLYLPRRGNSQFDELFQIFKATTISLLLIIAVTFFYREYSYSRGVMILFWALSFFLLTLSHEVVRWALMAIRKRGYNLRHILIVGSGKLGQTLADKIRNHPEIGFHIVGFLTEEDSEIGKGVADSTVIGHISDVKTFIHRHGIDQIFIALPINAHHRLETVLNALDEEVVDIKLVPDLIQYMRLNAGVDDLDGLPVVNLSESPMYGWNKGIKRIMDILLSGVFIVLLSPVMAAIALLVKAGSRGPVLYTQERMGLDGQKFRIYKFRTMVVDAEEQTGPVWAKENDHRRTRIGSYLRKTSLDELPQLFNVLWGTMSLVGPRPERPILVEQFKKSVPLYMLRHKMKAGITGWAQVNGWRGNTSLEKRIEYDLYYIENWSLIFDIKILWLTLWKGLVNKHAY